jgi:hypothetical protein
MPKRTRDREAHKTRGLERIPPIAIAIQAVAALASIPLTNCGG